MKKVAEDLEKITQPSLDIYTKKTKLSEKEIKEKMDKEEWITSQEAYDWGFSTSKEREEKYMQALEANFVHDLVMKNKDLQKQINKLEQEVTVLDKKAIYDEPEFIETIKETTEQTITNTIKQLLQEEQKEKLTKLLKKQEETDSWESFFNVKNKEKEGI